MDIMKFWCYCSALFFVSKAIPYIHQKILPNVSMLLLLASTGVKHEWRPYWEYSPGKRILVTYYGNLLWLKGLVIFGRLQKYPIYLDIPKI